MLHKNEKGPLRCWNSGTGGGIDFGGANSRNNYNRIKGLCIQFEGVSA